MSVHCSLVVTYWERANLLALLFVMSSCIFVTLPCGVLGQLWFLIVLTPDLCLLPCFNKDLHSDAHAFNVAVPFVLGLVMRKPVFGDSDNANFKPVTSATETS